MTVRDAEPPADVGLVLEGTYPYVAGGVSSWVHDLLRAHPDLTFDIIAMVPDERPRKRRYEVPANVRNVHDLPLQAPPLGRAIRLPSRLLALLQRLAAGTAGLDDLSTFEEFRAGARGKLGRLALLDSPAAFEVMSAAYGRSVPDASFLDFFWSWRALLNGVVGSLLMPPVPARCYHAVSTGFAGLLAARLAVAARRPLILSEHGIYTNERRIEIAMADWLHRGPERGLMPEKTARDLRDIWIAAFEGYARLTYAAADPIITLYRGNQFLQKRDGADPARLRIIPNGIDAARYAAIPREDEGRAPTVALIGRVVPIKDIKTFIRAAGILVQRVPEVQVEILGPQEEDPVYARECGLLVQELGLAGTVHFRGRVAVTEWLGKIDVHVLTSISEAQPLTILEAGAAGVPCVATDVGACREMIEGDPTEPDGIGPGGAVTPVADPAAVAEAVAALLLDPERRARAAAAMQARIRARFLKSDCDAAYARLYADALGKPDRPGSSPTARGAA
ncbi:GT4 family glycosyltransferase PelF [Muricoccus radiodurans]|uniref:GT4 family glycosyltransferase PelF n=1 Tax=Muricoccus radiodurans TaxID=2231721 RepID=UPI003CF8FFAB